MVIINFQGALLLLAYSHSGKGFYFIAFYLLVVSILYQFDFFCFMLGGIDLVLYVCL